MSPLLETRATQIFLEALELASDERDAFVDLRCVDNPALHARVCEILEQASKPRPDGTPPEKLASQTVFGDFRILQLLGEGGMGTVYSAQQNTPFRKVALKVIRSDRISKTSLRRFEKEVQALGSLQHPGIAQVYGAGTVQRPGQDWAEPYLAMELIEGTGLLDYVNKNALDRDGRIALVARICDAIHHAHQRGVIHRDLKPENILVVEAETTIGGGSEETIQRPQPKILDFGIARFTGDPAATQTRAGELVGTLAYMSPEQLGGNPQNLVDERTDVYALGVLLYQLLTDKLPHDLADRSVPESISVLVTQPARPIETHDPTLRGDIATMVARAIDPDLAQRYGSAAAFGRDLQHFLNGEPIQARSHSRLYRLSRRLERNRNKIMMSTSALLLVAFGAGLLRDQAREVEVLAAESEAQIEATLESLRQIMTANSPVVSAAHTTSEQRVFMEALLESHETLLRNRPAHEGLRHATAESRVQIGRIQIVLARQEGLASLRLGVEELLQLEKDATEPSPLLAMAQLWRSIAEHWYGDQERALAAAIEAERLYEALGRGGEAASAINQQAAALRVMGKPEQAKAERTRALRRAEASPEDPRAMSARLNALTDLAVFAVEEQEDLHPIHEAYVSLIAWMEQQEESESKAGSLLHAKSNYGRLCFAMGKIEEAEAVYLSTCEEGEELQRRHPNSPIYSRILFHTYANLGALHGMADRVSDSRESLERGLEILEELESTYPGIPAVRPEGALLRTHLATNRDEEGRKEEAAALFHRVLPELQHFVDEDKMRGLTPNLAIAVNGSAFAHLREGRYETAAETLRQFPVSRKVDVVGRALSIYSMCLGDLQKDENVSAEGRAALSGDMANQAAELLVRSCEAGFRDLDPLRDPAFFGKLLEHPAYQEVLSFFEE